MAKILGMDGGGTKTKAYLFEYDAGKISEPLKAITAGPSSLTGSTAKQVYDNLKSILDELQLHGEDLAFVGLGTAGISRPDTQTILLELFHKLGIEQALIVGDQEAALRGALGKEPGILLIAGTGSIAFGQHDDRYVRVGGYGHLIDDAGSGYALGQEILRQTIRVIDGRKAPTELTRQVMERLGKGDPQATLTAIMDICYTPPFDKSEIASLAVLLDERIEAGDEDAINIAREGVNELLLLGETAARKLALTKANLVLAGSLLLKSEPYRQLFAQALQESPISFKLREAKADAATGAALLAADHFAVD